VCHDTGERGEGRKRRAAQEARGERREVRGAGCEGLEGRCTLHVGRFPNP